MKQPTDKYHSSQERGLLFSSFSFFFLLLWTALMGLRCLECEHRESSHGLGYFSPSSAVEDLETWRSRKATGEFMQTIL